MKLAWARLAVVSLWCAQGAFNTPMVATVEIAATPVQQSHSERFLSAGWEVAQLVDESPFLNSSVFIKAASYLQPGFLRVGGISADWMEYEYLDPWLGGWWPDTEYQFVGSKIREMLLFTNKTGLSLLWDLNELFGRNCHTGPNNITCNGDWNTSNIELLLGWMAASPNWMHEGNVVGIELGNEITRSHHLEMDQQITDYVQLRDMVTRAWSKVSPGSAPLPISGPSTDICDNTSEAFMLGTQPFLEAFNYHSYPAGGCANPANYYSMVLSPRWLRERVWLNDHHANASVCASQWHSTGLAAKGVHLQMTETNSCYDMDGPNMNGIANTFWYVSSLGQLALAGLRMHSRWNMVSDHFGFLAEPQGEGKPWQAAADYWFAIAYKRAIGTGAVFNATSEVGAMGLDSPVLVYAHCAGGSGPQGVAWGASYPQGALALMIVNVANSSASTVSVSLGGSALADTPRLEWVFTAAPLPGQLPFESNRTVLNGASSPLQLGPDGSIPDMTPRSVAAGGGAITLPPLSASIVVLEAAGVSACGQAAQE